MLHAGGIENVISQKTVFSNSLTQFGHRANILHTDSQGHVFTRLSSSAVNEEGRKQAGMGTRSLSGYSQYGLLPLPFSTQVFIENIHQLKLGFNRHHQDKTIH